MIDIITESLRTIVSSGKGGQGDLISALKQLDDILEANGSELDARLRHFLQNRSYEKALLWIEGYPGKRNLSEVSRKKERLPTESVEEFWIQSF